MIVMGVDLGISKVACSVWDGDQLLHTGARGSLGRTRAGALQDIASWAAVFADKYTPDYIYIEDVLIGNNRKYSLGLAEAKGAVMSHLAHRLVYTVNVSTWKREVIGKGNATKDEVRSWLIAKDPAYAVTCGNDQDQYDAAAIGFYGQLIADRAAVLVDTR